MVHSAEQLDESANANDTTPKTFENARRLYRDGRRSLRWFATSTKALCCLRSREDVS